MDASLATTEWNAPVWYHGEVNNSLKQFALNCKRIYVLNAVPEQTCLRGKSCKKKKNKKKIED